MTIAFAQYEDGFCWVFSLRQLALANQHVELVSKAGSSMSTPTRAVTQLVGGGARDGAELWSRVREAVSAGDEGVDVQHVLFGGVHLGHYTISLSSASRPTFAALLAGWLLCFLAPLITGCRTFLFVCLLACLLSSWPV